MLDWSISILQKAQSQEMNTFVSDFTSALLANLLHSTSTLETLESDKKKTEDIMDKLLNLINGVSSKGDGQNQIPLQTSVLIHLLVSLSYLSKERFQACMEATQFHDRISMFVEMFSLKQVGENDHESSDKKIILDLCAHMHHPKDKNNENDISATMEYNELKQEEKIREFQSA